MNTEIQPKQETKKLLKLYRDMVYVRKIESLAYKLYMARKITGFCHLSLGQEAVIAGICYAMSSHDHIISSYRSHGYNILLNSAESTIGELMGDRRGCCNGKGGSMHLASPENGFWGGHGIVGTPFSIGAGLAFGKSYKKEPGVIITTIGDGAINQGQVYETFNMASIWQLPIIFIIENNQYAMGTSVQRSSANCDTLHMRGEPFGIKGSKVDGMDVLEVANAIDNAKKDVIKNKAPVLLEIITYRYCGHSMSDPGTAYRTRSEVNKVKESQDPIRNLIDVIGKVNAGKGLEQIDSELDQIVDQIETKFSDPIRPDASAIYEDIYI